MSETDDERQRRLRMALEVELLPEQTEDESGAAWGERPAGDGLQWYRDGKPPHHL